MHISSVYNYIYLPQILLLGLKSNFYDIEKLNWVNSVITILDIPLLLENKINKKNDILIFVQSKKKDILKRLEKRKNFNQILFNRFKEIQLPLDFKKKKISIYY